MRHATQPNICGAALADIDTPRGLNAEDHGVSRLRRRGLVEITFDESEGQQSDSTACCKEKPGPMRRFLASQVRAARRWAPCSCRRS